MCIIAIVLQQPTHSTGTCPVGELTCLVDESACIADELTRPVGEFTFPGDKLARSVGSWIDTVRLVI